MSTQGIVRFGIAKLYLIIAGLLCVLLGFVYEKTSSGSDPWNAFFLDILPNLAAALISFLVVYVFARWVGIATEEKGHDAESQGKTMVPDLTEQLTRIEAKLEQRRVDGIAQFYAEYRDVKWEEWLLKAESEQIIIVNYAHTWLGNHEKSLVSFLQKPKTTLTIYLPNPEDQATIDQLHFIYHAVSDPVTKHELANKIRNTAKRLYRLAEQAGVDKDRVRVWWLKQRPNYALHIIDQKWAVLSLYDHQRILRVGSPSFVLDLTVLNSVREYFNEAIEKLVETASKDVP